MKNENNAIIAALEAANVRYYVRNNHVFSEDINRNKLRVFDWTYAGYNRLLQAIKLEVFNRD